MLYLLIKFCNTPPNKVPWHPGAISHQLQATRRCIGQAAQSVVDALGILSPQIKNAKIGDISVSQFTGAVVPIVVAKFQQAPLERS